MRSLRRITQPIMKLPFLLSKRIERFSWFDAWLARGGQPSAQALEWLKMQGIRVIVDLREKSERDEVVCAGLQFVHIPVKNDEPPTLTQILQWLNVCATQYRIAPLFVHCHGGEGRTSVFCAAVRLAQGCGVADAIAEQERFNFEPDGTHRRQAQFLRELAEQVDAGIVTLPVLPRPAHAPKADTKAR